MVEMIRFVLLAALTLFGGCLLGCTGARQGQSIADFTAEVETVSQALVERGVRGEIVVIAGGSSHFAGVSWSTGFSGYARIVFEPQKEQE